MSGDIEARRRRRVIWIVVTAVSLPLVFFAYQRMHGVNMLRAKLHDLKTAGEEIDFRKIVRPIPPAESNAVVLLTNYFDRIDSIDNLLRSRPEEWKLESDFRRRPYFEVKEWEAKIWVGDSHVDLTNDWPQFIAEFELHTNLLNSVRSALKRPAFYSGYRPSDGFFKLPMVVNMSSRRIEKLLAAGFSYHVRGGRLSEADACLRSLLRLIDGMGHDQLIISELIRLASMHTARNVIWQGLQLPGWSDEQLAAWSDGIGRIEISEGMLNAHRMERAIAYTHFQRLGGREGNAAERKQAWDTAWESMERNALNEYLLVPCWYLVWQEQDYCQNLDAWSANINHLRSAVQVGWFEMSKPGKSGILPFRPVSFKSPSDNWWNSFRYAFSIHSFSLDPENTTTRIMCELALQRLTLTAIAIARYELRHGKTPPDLQVLVPDFLPKVPVDPIDLKPLRFQNDGDSWRLYSIGINGLDEGGNPSPIDPGATSVSASERKDIVWPQPAR